MVGAFTGIFALGLIVLPGISYRIGREYEFPARRIRGFRETALLIFPGIVTTFASLSLFGAWRALRPSNSPDVGELLREPGEYFQANVPYLLGWMAAILFVACCLAFSGGLLVTRRLGARDRIPKSSWADWLERGEHGDHIYCFLEGGVVISGFLAGANNGYEETRDRDICLFDPWYYSTPSADPVKWERDGVVHEDEAAVVIISARHVKFLIAVPILAHPSPPPGALPESD